MTTATDDQAQKHKVVLTYILATLEHDRLAYEWMEDSPPPKGEGEVEGEGDTVRAAKLEAAMAAKGTAWVALCETFGVHP